MKKQKDPIFGYLLVVGTPVVDYYAKVSEKFLKENKLKKGSTTHTNIKNFEKLKNKVKIIRKIAGDNSKNVALAYKFLGGKSCFYAGTIGNDEDGKIFCSSLKRYKVIDLTKKLNNKKTGKILCLITPDKERTFLAYLGAGIQKINIKNLLKIEPKVLFFTNFTLIGKLKKSIIKLIKKLKQKKTKIAFGIESELFIKKHSKEIIKLAKYSDYIFLNQKELEAFKKNKKEFLKTNATIFLKKGKDGCQIIKNEKIILNEKTKPLKKIVDSTGAGDFFNGAVLFGLEKDYQLKKIAKLANKTARKILTKIGTES
jgi:sugar/nucleoside kinase (ribokinase family)